MVQKNVLSTLRVALASGLLLTGTIGPVATNMVHADENYDLADNFGQVSDEDSTATEDETYAEPTPVEPIDAAEANASDSDGNIDDTSSEEAETEVIHERYPNRTVKIERHVAQDSAGNYFNHGTWINWDEHGNLLARGEYRDGLRNGKWMRWYGATDGKVFDNAATKGFEKPFGTEASFKDGRLDGVWTVFDAKKRPVCEWTFENGVRNGRSAWFSPSGQLTQEVTFKNGQMDGDLMQLVDGKMGVRERYIEGRRIVRNIENHSPGAKKLDGGMLYALTYATTNYDWWTGSVEVVPAPKGSVNQRHGMWTRWYPNGQKQFEGRYDNDRKIGKFTWWYSNGQIQLQGNYTDGEQEGKFVWWYPTGQKQLQGEYVSGVPTGNWTRWTAEGKVVQVEDYRAKEAAETAGDPDTLEPTAGRPIDTMTK